MQIEDAYIVVCLYYLCLFTVLEYVEKSVWCMHFKDNYIIVLFAYFHDVF
jgi:hypothetical protein